MEDIITIVESLKESGLLIKGVIKTVEKEAKEQEEISSYIIRYIRR